MYLPIPGLARLAAYVPDPTSPLSDAPSHAPISAAAERTAHARILVALETACGARSVRNLDYRAFGAPVIATIAAYHGSGTRCGARLISLHLRPGSNAQDIDVIGVCALGQRRYAITGQLRGPQLCDFTILGYPTRTPPGAPHP
ncbi:hypothetical protein ACUY3K_07435 [Corynebacterium uberis]|uniref:hypothetical protein n=1 Tax=Corynebacterium TaxID=1716 RepID=UPI001D0AC3C4|nr:MULTISPECIES: hypothetical protein [Corynebacterium]MCZ9309224.1 hypothetical protein [Corynebacterium sp. c6VSa_13]UDL72782.1 hypothetical protein LH391_06565 [Corynebacterium uberis]UDL76341.1 hypothetical protein LH393_02835 [Corynebacterium uberis]UDL78553.1 hypothetical protein LH394_02820 [Corynebacterium uberis]UDL80834.1 hypothetical protein LH392_03250 [Corynebacterium uberis]